MKSLNITNYNLFVQYLADYVSEEISRGEVITTYTIEDAIDAYMGGAADEEETTPMGDLMVEEHRQQYEQIMSKIAKDTK